MKLGREGQGALKSDTGVHVELPFACERSGRRLAMEAWKLRKGDPGLK